MLLQWIGVGQMIEQRNRLLNGRCQEILSNLTSVGLHPTILKGQGIVQCYPAAGYKSIKMRFKVQDSSFRVVMS